MNTHDRPDQAKRSVADRAVGIRQVVHLGSWKVPVGVVAVGLSVVLHAGLFAASYFVNWGAAPTSVPEVSFARGDQSTRVQVLLVPWPAPADEETEPRPQEDASATDLSATSADAEEIVVESPAEELTPESNVDPPTVDSEDSSPLEEGNPVATDVAEVVEVEEMREVSPANDAEMATLQTQSVEELIEFLREKMERFLALSATSEPKDHTPPLAVEAVEKAPTQPVEETERSDSSSAQTAGVETGIETLDLPVPHYPSLSRKRGEEGLVLLQVEVLRDGSVGTVTVLTDAGYTRLTKAAIAAARKGRFKPATRDGQPVQATVRIPFRFVLK